MKKFIVGLMLLGGVGFYWPYEQPPAPYGYLGGVHSDRYQEDVHLLLKQHAWDLQQQAMEKWNQDNPLEPIQVRPLPREGGYEKYLDVD